MEQEESLGNAEDPEAIWAEHVEQRSQAWKLEQRHPFQLHGETKDTQTSQTVASAAERTPHTKDSFPCEPQKLNVRWLENSTPCLCSARTGPTYQRLLSVNDSRLE